MDNNQQPPMPNESMSDVINARFERAVQGNAALAAIRISQEGQGDDGLKLMVAFLAERLAEVTASHLAAQYMIPRRIRLPDGRVLRWDAPDDIVPIGPATHPALQSRE